MYGLAGFLLILRAEEKGVKRSWHPCTKNIMDLQTCQLPSGHKIAYLDTPYKLWSKTVSSAYVEQNDWLFRQGYVLKREGD
jgi:hypothetical protein